MPILNRKAVPALLLGLLFSITAHALTLGDLVVHSRPGQPLRASIPITLQADEQLAQIRASLATAKQYAIQHQEYPPFLEGVHVALLDKGDAHARIQLFGEKPWQGEEAVLILEVTWPQGQVSQRFRLAGVAPADSSTATTPRYVEVGENDTLDAIAIRLSRGSNRSYLHMMYALFKANPDAFYGGNMNNLKHGARLRVPTESELYQLSDAEVYRGIREQSAEWKQQNEVSGTGGSEMGSTGSTNGQTVLPGRGESEEKMQAQLQRLNNENEAIEQRNEQLKARLAKLEQQMQQMTKQVLDYPDVTQDTQQPTELPTIAKSDADKEKSGNEVSNKASTEPSDNGEAKQSESLPDYLLALVMMLVVGAGMIIWRRADPAQRGRR